MYWTVPSLAKGRSGAVTFIHGEDRLAVATFESNLYIFDLKAKRLTPWSAQYGFPVEKWPTELKTSREFPVRLISNPSDPSQLILVSESSQ